MGNAWTLVLGAVAAEIVAALLLRASNGFRNAGMAALALGSFAAAFYSIGLALTKLPVSNSYPVWAGGGTAGVAIAGVVLFGERLHPVKLVGVLLVIAGIVVIGVATGTQGATV